MTEKLSNAQIAWRAAQDIEDGAYVNLGIGFPEMVARYQPDGCEVIFHSENGILGFGNAPPEGSEDWDLINAGKKPVTLKPGAAIFHHADSFAMVRGGHLDVAILVLAQRAYLLWVVQWIWYMEQSGWRLSRTISPKTESPSWLKVVRFH